MSQLGGIGVTVQGAVAGLGFIFIVQYMLQLSGVIHRQKKRKYRLIKINKMVKYIPMIIDRIEEL